MPTTTLFPCLCCNPSGGGGGGGGCADQGGQSCQCCCNPPLTLFITILNDECLSGLMDGLHITLTSPDGCTYTGQTIAPFCFQNPAPDGPPPITIVTVTMKCLTTGIGCAGFQVDVNFYMRGTGGSTFFTICLGDAIMTGDATDITCSCNPFYMQWSDIAVLWSTFDPSGCCCQGAVCDVYRVDVLITQ